MPALARGHDHRRPVPALHFHGSFRISFLQHCCLDCLTFAIELFKPLGDRLCLRRIIQRKKAASKRRVTNPPARIDAGADQKSQMIGRDRSVDTGALTEGCQSGIAQTTSGEQALDHEGPVEPLERHHVADCRQRDQIKTGKKIEA
jgi:hypothetical protein